jgi:hypothetical protein
MKARLNWLPILVATILAMAAGTMAARPARAAAEGHFDRTLKVTGPVDLNVETGSGSISMRTGSSDSVQIHATIRGNDGWHLSDKDLDERVHAIEAHPPIEQDGNTIRIGRFDDHEMTRNISISYELVVPAATKSRTATGSGSQSLDGVGGPVEATSGSGSLQISNVGAEVTAHTGSGSIELRSIKGSARTSTGSGSVRALGIAGGLKASTGSGSVKLEQTAAGDVEVETGSGSIEMSGVKGSASATTGSGSITAEGEPSGRWRLHTASGSVRVHVPDQAGYEIDAHTNSGRIESNLPITVQGTISPRELHGKVRGGGAVLDLSTSSGNVYIQ